MGLAIDHQRHVLLLSILLLRRILHLQSVTVRTLRNVASYHRFTLPLWCHKSYDPKKKKNTEAGRRSIAGTWQSVNGPRLGHYINRRELKEKLWQIKNQVNKIKKEAEKQSKSKSTEICTVMPQQWTQRVWIDCAEMRRTNAGRRQQGGELALSV